MSVQIETENLGRYFGEIKAVDGISFQVKQGEVLGFLGPNGAGKSTTMKLLTCFLAPSFGTARIAGFDLLSQPREVRANLGYLPENAPLYGDMDVLDLLNFIAEVRGMEKKARREALERVISLTSLQSVVNQRVETLSKGFKRRVGLAQALLHDPKILILDEPTDGLDPNQKHDVRQLILSMAKEKTILLSTHILEEVDAVCSRAVIIAKGKILADDAPDELRKRSKVYGNVIISLPRPLPGDLVGKLENLPAAKQVVETGSRDKFAAYALAPKDQSLALLRSVLELVEREKWQLADLRMESGELEDVFRRITQ